MRLRIHMLFGLFVALALFLSTSHQAAAEVPGLPRLVLVGLLVLFLSVLAQAWARFCTAVHFGGRGDEIVLWPLGSLTVPVPPTDPRHELAMHLAGPVANLAISGVAGIVVASLAIGDVAGILQPLTPLNLLEPREIGFPLVLAKLVCWINLVLALVNLLPAFPLDGGRALRAALLARRPDLGPRQSLLLVTGLAKLGAVICLVAAVIQWSNGAQQAIPIWFSLVLLAMVLFFGARQAEESQVEVESDDKPFGYDFSRGYSSLEAMDRERADLERPEGTASELERDEQAGSFRRWLAERREAKRLQQQQQEEEDERRVDEILSRLHEHGMDSLTTEERLLLQRVSQRYRLRQERS